MGSRVASQEREILLCYLRSQGLQCFHFYNKYEE
jgi:hypothetical protein